MSNRRWRRTTSRAALSWLDVLLVLAIILVFVLILLPSLRDARRQARVAKCLAHLRELTTATNMYCLDWSDVFPLTPLTPGKPRRAFSYAYGGKTNADFWRSVADGAGFIPAADRPLNKYLGSGQERVLQCPADHTSYARAAFGAEPVPLPIACHEDIGTSFHFNLHALTGTSLDGDADDGANWGKLSQAMFRIVLSRRADTFLPFLTDPMHYALPKHQRVVGNHGQRGKHEVGFMDGHAEYRDFDTSRWEGHGWTALIPEWRTRDQAAAIHYIDPDKTATPDLGANPRTPVEEGTKAPTSE